MGLNSKEGRGVGEECDIACCSVCLANTIMMMLSFETRNVLCVYI